MRRFFGGKGEFWPFARAGVGVAIVRFADDDVTGLAVPLHARRRLARLGRADSVAIIAQAELELGFGWLQSRARASSRSSALSVTAGAEFRL